MELLYLRLHALLDRAARIAVWAGGLALLLSAVMVTVDVTLRKLFAVTMSGSDEITGYVFAAATTWAYSYCLLHRANIRIDAFYNLLPRAAKAVLDLLGLVLLLVFMAVLTHRAALVLAESIKNDSVAISTMATPLWIPQTFWLGGLLLFVITLIFTTSFALYFLLRGNLARVQSIAGVLSVEEEIEEETRGTAGERHARREN